MRIRVNRAKDRIEIDFQVADGNFAQPILDIDTGARELDPAFEVIKLKTTDGLPGGHIEVDGDGYIRRVTIPGVDALIRAVKSMVAES